jgi:hypothetical protein
VLDAGVGHQDVEAPVPRHRAPDRGCTGIGIGDVEGHGLAGEPACGELGCAGVERAGVARVQHHVGARLRERLRHRPAESA